MPDNIQILSTRIISKSLLEQAAEYGITVDSIPFIEIEVFPKAEIKDLVASISKGTEVNVVFTSSNAVEAIRGLKVDAAHWNVYGMAGATGEALRRVFPEAVIKGEADSASELATEILKDKEVEKVFFFCGDKRRDELPSILKEHGIAVSEIIVYMTTPTPVRVEKEYDGILFFSPSAVKSYLQQNEVKERTVIFAIGNTTATALDGVSNNVIVSERPGTEELIKRMIKHFRPEAALK
jgi:uroporphyrinogen-III synthase